jgi:hypothetical protein
LRERLILTASDLRELIRIKRINDGAKFARTDQCEFASYALAALDQASRSMEKQRQFRLTGRRACDPRIQWREPAIQSLRLTISALKIVRIVANDSTN